MAKMNQKSRRTPSKPLPPPPFLTFEWQTPSLSPFSPRAATSFQTINQFFSFYLLSFIPLPSPPPYSQFRTAKHLGGNLILTSLGRMKGKERKKRLMITPLHLLLYSYFPPPFSIRLNLYFGFECDWRLMNRRWPGVRIIPRREESEGAGVRRRASLFH